MILYTLLKWFFRWCLLVFYSHVEVEGAEYINDDDDNNTATILVANHANSLTDAAVIMTSARRMVRLTAKDTLWRDPFWRFFVSGVGTVPIKRRRDHDGNTLISNADAFAELYTTVERGGCICLFPEGISRYHPSLAELRPGVGRIAIDIVNRMRSAPGFTLRVIVVGITYTHRARWRSNVLVKVSEPIVLRHTTNDRVVATQHNDEVFCENHDDSDAMAATLMQRVHHNFRNTVIDAPTWNDLTIAHTARRIVCPFGTTVSLGYTMQVARHFLHALQQVRPLNGDPSPMCNDDDSVYHDYRSCSCVDPRTRDALTDDDRQWMVENVARIRDDLHVYESDLNDMNIKDYRVYQSAHTTRVRLMVRIVMRVAWSIVLFVLALPGLLLWAPVFYLANRKERQILRKSVEDNMDEVAMHKMAYGVFLLPFEWFVLCIFTLPIIWITIWLIPLLVWMAIRWLEDGIACTRSIISLYNMVKHQGRLALVRERRARLENDLRRLADLTGLPSPTPEKYSKCGRVLQYFSLLRRRTKDWNEIMRLHEVAY